MAKFRKFWAFINETYIFGSTIPYVITETTVYGGGHFQTFEHPINEEDT